MNPNAAPLAVALAAAGVLLYMTRRQDMQDGTSYAIDPATGDAIDLTAEGGVWQLDQGTDMTTRAAPASTWTYPARGEQYRPAIEAAEDRNGIPRGILGRLLYQESRFRQDIITGQTRSAAGAIGIAQFLPATAADMGVNPLDINQSIDGAGRYLARLYKKFGAWDLALAAYNWGEGNLARKGIAAAPTETRNYYTQILGDTGYA